MECENLNASPMCINAQARMNGSSVPSTQHGHRKNDSRKWKVAHDGACHSVLEAKCSSPACSRVASCLDSQERALRLEEHLLWEGEDLALRL